MSTNPRSNFNSDSLSGIQGKIEQKMRQFEEEDRWERIILFSSEGLPMASHGNSPSYNNENLLEFAFSLIGAVKLLSKDLPVMDIVIRGQEKRLLIFRYFKAWEENLVLSVVAAGKKGYRRALNQLVKLIESLG